MNASPCSTGRRAPPLVGRGATRGPATAGKRAEGRSVELNKLRREWVRPSARFSTDHNPGQGPFNKAPAVNGRYIQDLLGRAALEKRDGCRHHSPAHPQKKAAGAGGAVEDKAPRDLHAHSDKAYNNLQQRRREAEGGAMDTAKRRRGGRIPARRRPEPAKSLREGSAPHFFFLRAGRAGRRRIVSGQRGRQPGPAARKAARGDDGGKEENES